MPDTIRKPAAYSPTAPSTGSGISVSAMVSCGRKAISASSAAAAKPTTRAVERVAYTSAMLAELTQVGKPPSSPMGRSPKPLALMPPATARMLARFQSASSILSSMMTLPSMSSCVRMATRATATIIPASRLNTGVATVGSATSGTPCRAYVLSSRPSSAASTTPAPMASSRAMRRRRPPQTDSTTMPPSVTPATRALAPSTCHWPSPTPRAWRTEEDTSAMPPMQITTPTTGGGNSARMWRTSGAMASATSA